MMIRSIKIYLFLILILCSLSCKEVSYIRIKYDVNCEDFAGIIKFKKEKQGFILNKNNRICYLPKEKFNYKNGDTIYITLKSFGCGDSINGGFYDNLEDFIIFKDSDTIIKYINLNPKDTINLRERIYKEN